MTEIAPAPTDSGIARRRADFAHLSAAFEHAATGETGLTFYGARGQVIERRSWAELYDGARLTAGRLLARGLVPGDRVAILAETGPGFVEALMGCLRVGLIPCPAPLPAAFGARGAYIETLLSLIRSAEARAVLAPGMFGDWVAEAFGAADMVFAGPMAELDNAPTEAAAITPDVEATAYLQFTSGTTRAPKGIAVSHRAMMANLAAMADRLGIADGDRMVSWLPWYHDMGLVGAVMAPMACQLSVDCLATRDFMVRPGLWLELIGRNGGTVSYAPSFGYELAARRARPRAELDLGSWRVAGIGGDMVRAGALSEFARAFEGHGFRKQAFVPSYGMAEATLGLAFTPCGRGALFEHLDATALTTQGEARAPEGEARAIELARCGPPLPDHRIEIRDAKGVVLPEGKVGRVMAAGPGLMQGYFQEPAETARALGADGWLDTGDLGYLVEGELVITGRSKDMLIVNGRNVWPQDVEWSIETALGAVRAGGAAVFGAGEAGMPDDGRIVLVLESRESAEEARADLRREAHALARQIHGIDAEVVLCRPRALPRTTSGKLRRDETRRMFLAGAFGG